jgi:hypothetical protein
VLRLLTIANVARVASWVLLVALVVVTLSPIEYRPKTGHVLSERAVAFALLGLLWGVGYPRRRWGAAAGLLAVIVLLEFAQGFVPGRHGQVLVGLEKLTGGAFGLAAAAVWDRWRRSRQELGG